MSIFKSLTNPLIQPIWGSLFSVDSDRNNLSNEIVFVFTQESTKALQVWYNSVQQVDVSIYAGTRCGI